MPSSRAEPTGFSAEESSAGPNALEATNAPADPLDRLRGLSVPCDEAELHDALEGTAAAFGFSHAAAFSLASADESGTATRYVLGTWPLAFQRAYEQHGLHRFKLVIAALRADPAPFVWDIDTLHGADDPDPPPAAKMLDAAGYRAGILLPVHGMTAFDGALSFAGQACDLSREAERQLHLFAMVFFGMLSAARFETNRVNNPLSQRERDCLRLAMLGKTSSEAGIILDLSEYTISQYFTAAQRKLGASNRTHAVAIAAQNGYLS